MAATRTYLTAHPTADGNGKYHAASPVTGLPACGATPTLDLDPMKSIHVRPGTDTTSVHPIVCRRCLAAATH